MGHAGPCCPDDRPIGPQWHSLVGVGDSGFVVPARFVVPRVRLPLTSSPMSVVTVIPASVAGGCGQRMLPPRSTRGTSASFPCEPTAAPAPSTARIESVAEGIGAFSTLNVGPRNVVVAPPPETPTFAKKGDVVPFMRTL